MTMLPYPERMPEHGMDVVVAAYRAIVAVPPPVPLTEIGAVCPIDDTMLSRERSGWSCPTCLACWDEQGRGGMWLGDGQALTAAVVAEDDLEAAGLLAADDRRTCHICRVWINPGHTASTEHWAAIDAAAATVSWQELTEVACPVPVPDGVHGMCWRPRPCPDHDNAHEGLVVLADEQPAVDEDATARLRRLDRRCALTIGITAGGGFGFAAGRIALPWAHLVPDTVVWALAGGLVVVAVTAAGAVQAWRWWPYRHNRVLGTAAELGWDTPAEGEVPDVR